MMVKVYRTLQIIYTLWLTWEGIIPLLLSLCSTKVKSLLNKCQQQWNPLFHLRPLSPYLPSPPLPLPRPSSYIPLRRPTLLSPRLPRILLRPRYYFARRRASRRLQAYVHLLRRPREEYRRIRNRGDAHGAE